MLEYITSCITTFRSWSFWLVVLLIILFIIWLVFGRKTYKFVGLQPLQPGERITPYLLPSGDPPAVVRTSDPQLTMVQPLDPPSVRPQSPLEARTPLVAVEQTPQQVVNNTPSIPEEVRRGRPMPLDIEEKDEGEEKEEDENGMDPELGIPKKKCYTKRTNWVCSP